MGSRLPNPSTATRTQKERLTGGEHRGYLLNKQRGSHTMRFPAPQEMPGVNAEAADEEEGNRGTGDGRTIKSFL